MLGYLFLDVSYVLLKASSFPQATLSENCSFTDNVRGQISELIFAPDGGYCLYINVFMFLFVFVQCLLRSMCYYIIS